MAAPDFVPSKPTDKIRVYSAPPRRITPQTAPRPGSLSGPQPRAAGLGSIGPDQGYAYKLVENFDLHTGDVHRSDAVAGCVAVATKRASLYGRAPVVHDLEIAFTIFGFLDESPDEELQKLRRELFAEVHHGHHYRVRRQLADTVPEEALNQSPEAVNAAYRLDWRRNLSV